MTESAPPEISSTDSTVGVASSGEPGQGPSAEAERPRSIESPLRVFVGGGAATSLGAPVSISTFRYEGGVAYRVSAPLELSLAIGGTELSLLGTRDATWPAYEWLGQFYADLSVRYRVMKLGPGVLFALGSGRLSFFTAAGLGARAAPRPAGVLGRRGRRLPVPRGHSARGRAAGKRPHREGLRRRARARAARVRVLAPQGGAAGGD